MLFQKLPLETIVIRRDRTGWSEARILGDELRIARESLGLSQIQLAERIHLARSSISKIESGKREISQVELRLWVNETGRSITDLYTIVELNLTPKASQELRLTI